MHGVLDLEHRLWELKDRNCRCVKEKSNASAKAGGVGRLRWRLGRLSHTHGRARHHVSLVYSDA